MRVQQPSVPGPASLCEREQRAVTYDLGKGATRRGGGGDGTGRGAGERMPRDVKERMKSLPRFISILKRGSGGVGGGGGGGRSGWCKGERCAAKVK